VERIKLTESLLLEKKAHLESFQSEFCDIKKKFEEACKKLKTDIDETQVSLCVIHIHGVAHVVV
jgi:hypothetical protein